MSRVRLALVALLGVAVVATAIAVVWTRHQTRMQFARLVALQEARDALDIEFARQEIERATWAEPSRIERIARERLHMIEPRAADTQVLQP